MGATLTAQQATRDRLLEAAGEIFAERGYRNATLRDICGRAEANNAAINYHFRDKEHIYFEVIEQEVEEIKKHFLFEEIDPNFPPEIKLHTFVSSMVRGMFDENHSCRFLKIMMQEIAEPTRGLDIVVEKIIRPTIGRLGVIVGEILGPTVDERTLYDYTVSVMALCGEFHRGRAIHERLGMYTTFDQAAIEHIIEHILRFSLAALHAAHK